MKRLLKNYRLPENTEILFMLVLGILLQMTDGSPFSIKERWMIVWDTELPIEYFSLFVQQCIKTVLSMIVVVRCTTTYAYVVSAMLVIFCLLKDSYPKLMLLWLLISMIKSVCMTFIEALTGVYVCSAFGKIRKACIEFFVSKALEIIFAAYLWGSVLNIYQEMERKAEESNKLPTWEQLFVQRMNCMRYRARSLLDESTLYKTACLNLFEFKDVPQIILQMLRREEEMSQDSLLGPGMMLASVSNLGSFDSLKTSQSLGELGILDLKPVQVLGLEDDEDLTPPEKALKFLKLTWSDVRRAQRNKTEDVTNIHIIDDETWQCVMSSGIRINKPKQPRPEVFLREIPQIELEDFNDFLWERKRKKSFELKFGLSLFNFFQEKKFEFPEVGDDDQDEEEESANLDDDEEAEEDEKDEPSPLFMSNIKEEVLVNRIRLDFVSKAIKGNTYANLYKQDFMGVIGPEVFDRATKLPKMISFTKVTRKPELRSSASLPAFSESKVRSKKKINFDGDSIGRNQRSSNLDLDSESEKERELVENSVISLGKSHDSGRYSAEEAVVSIINETDESKNSYFSFSNSKKQSRDTASKIHFVLPSRKSQEKVSENPQNQPFFRKRRICIRREGKQKFPEVCENCINESKFGFPSTCESGLTSGTSIINSENEDWETKDCSGTNETAHKTFPSNKHIYFLTELLQKPLTDVLVTYYDLKNKVYKKEKADESQERDFESFLDNEFCMKSSQKATDSLESKQKRTWKSKVLESAGIGPEIGTKPNARFSNSNLLENSYALTRLLKKGYLLLGNEDSWIREKRFLHLNEDEPRLKLNAKHSPIFLFNSQSSKESNMFVGTENLTREKNTKFSSALTQSNISQSSVFNYKEDDFMSEAEPNSNESKELENRSCPSSDIISIKSESQISKPSTFSNTEVLYRVMSLCSNNQSSQKFGVSDENELASVESTTSVRDSGQESDESFSLYYSKEADLASPLMDMKRFIYPDHIHYSYKHVKKKGFDVDLTGGLPLLVRVSLTTNADLGVENDTTSTDPDLVITRRPMDMSFATTNAFAEWQNNDQYQTEPNITEFSKKNKSTAAQKTEFGSKKGRSSKEKKSKSKKYHSDFKYPYTVKDRLLIEKLLKMRLRSRSQKRDLENDRNPVQISSTQLHSNKGRISSTYNPAIYLQENRTRSEKKKADTQEERTKDMFARLEREALLQNRNMYKTHGSLRWK